MSLHRKFLEHQFPERKKDVRELCEMLAWDHVLGQDDYMVIARTITPDVLERFRNLSHKERVIFVKRFVPRSHRANNKGAKDESTTSFWFALCQWVGNRIRMRRA